MKATEILEGDVIDINPELERRKTHKKLADKYADEEATIRARLDKIRKERPPRIKGPRPEIKDELARKRIQDPSKHAQEFRRLSQMFKKDVPETPNDLQ